MPKGGEIDKEKQQQKGRIEMESSKPRTIRGKILMIFILTVIPFMMISALISTYSIETSNERVEASYTTLLEMLKRDIDNDLAIIDSKYEATVYDE